MKTSDKQSKYAPKAEHNYEYLSVDQIMYHTTDIGHHFFTRETRRFFGSKIYDDLAHGIYFITSEQDSYGAWDGKRRYTIRMALGDGMIDSYSAFGEFASLRSARTALANIEKENNK